MTEEKVVPKKQVPTFSTGRTLLLTQTKGEKTLVINLDRVPGLNIPEQIRISIGDKKRMMFDYLVKVFNMPLSNKAATDLFRSLMALQQAFQKHDDVMLVSESKKPWHIEAVTEFLNKYKESINTIAGFQSMSGLAALNDDPEMFSKLAQGIALKTKVNQEQNKPDMTVEFLDKHIQEFDNQINKEKE